MFRLQCLDYSNPSNWDSSKLTLNNANIPTLWKEGRHKAEIQFLALEAAADESKSPTLPPSTATEDNDPEIADNDEASNDPSSIVDYVAEPAGSKFDSQMLIHGKHFVGDSPRV